MSKPDEPKADSEDWRSFWWDALCIVGIVTILIGGAVIIYTFGYHDGHQEGYRKAKAEWIDRNPGG